MRVMFNAVLQIVAIMRIVRTQNLEKLNTEITTYRSVDEFQMMKSVPNGVLSITNGTQPIDVLNFNGGHETTIVCFHGAVEREVVLPWHVGQGVTDGLPVNRIFISDPVLYKSKDLGLAWYAGSVESPSLQSILAAIVRKIVELSGSKHVVFFGSSGGGFAALEMAHRFPNSLALAMNPQTRITEFFPRIVSNYFNIAWGLSETDESKLPADVHTDLVSLYEGGFSNKVGIIQNARDWFHIQKHQIPFLNVVGDSQSVIMRMDRWGVEGDNGHIPAPKDVLRPVFEQLAVASGDWKTALLRSDFQEDTTSEAVKLRVSTTASRA